jgi:hypothetical protein
MRDEMQTLLDPVRQDDWRRMSGSGPAARELTARRKRAHRRAASGLTSLGVAGAVLVAGGVVNPFGDRPDQSDAAARLGLTVGAPCPEIPALPPSRFGRVPEADSPIPASTLLAASDLGQAWSQPSRSASSLPGTTWPGPEWPLAEMRTSEQEHARTNFLSMPAASANWWLKQSVVQFAPGRGELAFQETARIALCADPPPRPDRPDVPRTGQRSAVLVDARRFGPTS